LTEELRALYENRPDLVRTPARVSFVQLFFKGEDGEERARAVLASLRSTGSDPAGMEGDRLLLGNVFSDEEEQALTSTFGAAFAKSVLSAEPGRWSGPFASAYGLHLVKVTASTPSKTRPFTEVRERLEREWQELQQRAARDQLYAALLRKYEVVVDPEVRRLLPQHLLKQASQ
jgi:hypothetical protein